MNAGFPPTRRNPPAFSAPPDPTGLPPWGSLHSTDPTAALICISIYNNHKVALALLYSFAALTECYRSIQPPQTYSSVITCWKSTPPKAVVCPSVGTICIANYISLSLLYTHTQVIQSEKNKTSFWLFDIRSSSTGVRGTVPVAES